MFLGPVSLEIDLYYLRPASHFNARGEIKPSAPTHPGYLDCDKAARAIGDALEGVAYRNDRQIYRLLVLRAWATDLVGPGAEIRLEGP